MRTRIKERWRKLCEQIATEQDPEKFLAAIEELNRVLEDRGKSRRNLSDEIYRANHPSIRGPTTL